MSDDLESRFQQAAADVQKLPRQPDTETLLVLYALYKQATKGDISGKRPGMTDFAGRAKYDAWAKLEGSSKEDAMRIYIDTVNDLIVEMNE